MQAVVLSDLCNKDVAVERTWMADVFSCNICTSYIHVGRIHSDLIKQRHASDRDAMLSSYKTTIFDIKVTTYGYS